MPTPSAIGRDSARAHRRPLDRSSIIVLANRQPLRHDYGPEGAIVASRSAGGLVTALEPVIRACSGVWVAHGAGSADRLVVDGRDGIDVPPAAASYRLRRVWLARDEVHGYYEGFANEGLWALCHDVGVSPVFRVDDFQTYRRVNGRFADAVCQEATRDDVTVLVQDYHFALAPAYIRARLPRVTIASFWHIPWPAPSTFSKCPWGRPLLEGLLGSTSIGFQTPEDRSNFLECVEWFLGRDVRVDQTAGWIAHRERRTAVRVYPVSIEWPSPLASASPSVEACRRGVRSEIRLGPNLLIGLGVDRLDYTKGLNEKFLAVERLLESRPALRGRFAFVQIAEPSRESLPVYRTLRSQLWATVHRINGLFGTDTYQPLILLDAHYDPTDVYRFMRAADFCYVGSLRDGMNLVAKEFVCARQDARGVLLLSEYTGAARELTSALLVDPRRTGDVARGMAAALDMRPEEQEMRMLALRRVVAQFTTYDWAARILGDAEDCKQSSSPRCATLRPHIEPIHA
jgi:trehalose 6-phosphate synthase